MQKNNAHNHKNAPYFQVPINFILVGNLVYSCHEEVERLSREMAITVLRRVWFEKKDVDDDSYAVGRFADDELVLGWRGAFDARKWSAADLFGSGGQRRCPGSGLAVPNDARRTRRTNDTAGESENYAGGGKAVFYRLRGLGRGGFSHMEQSST